MENLYILDRIDDVGYFRHPYRLDKMVITLVEQGSICGVADAKPFRAVGPCLLFLFPNSLIEYHEASRDLRVKILVMPTEFAKTLQSNDSFSAFFRLADNPIVGLRAEESVLVNAFYDLLRQMDGMENGGKQQAIKCIFDGFFHLVSHFEGYLQMVFVEKSPNDLLFERFHREVVKHYKESREVVFYADKLCMAPKYMANIIKRTTGKSANQWINEYVMLEAKSLLLNHPELPILEVSEQLGFPNQSFFTQFFKKYAGKTPLQFRG